MTSTEKMTETEEKAFQMELSSLETSCDSVLAKGDDLSGSTSSFGAACEKRAACDAAFGPPVEERSPQTSAKQPWSKRDRVSSSDESSSKGYAPTCLHFLKKLWDVVESDRFESISWGDNGKCVVINEDLFEEEVLARRGRLRIFESETMRSFTHHLHLHGFTRKMGIFPKSGSRSDLLAEETAREFHFYYNPNFRRHFPHQLMKYKQRFGPKHQTPAGFSPDTDLHARRQKRKPDVDPARETTSEEESSVFTAQPRKRPARAAARTRRASLWAHTTPCSAPCAVPCSAPCSASPCSSNKGEAQSYQCIPVAVARQPRRGTSRLSSCGGSSCCSLCAKATPGPGSSPDKQSLQ